jgi:HAD superfamily hydrolase (TIGR01509 family)
MTQILLFDLGNVLVEVTGARDIKPYLKGPLRVEGRWPAMEAWEAFEQGQLTPEEFSQRFVEQANLDLDPPAFLANFEGWTRGLFPGAVELLDALRPRFRLMALSNSNEVHWRRNDVLGVTRQFERAFASHEIGVRKPAAQAYEHVLIETGISAADVTFFDDQQPNVDGARNAGLDAHRVEGIDELRACLQGLGFL